MLNIDRLGDELGRILGDHAEIECEIDNVQAYLDGVTARRRVAPEIDETGWLILLGLYRADRSRGQAMTVSQACSAAPCPSGKAVAQVTALLKGGFVDCDKTVPNAATTGRRLRLTEKGGKAVASWLALMHLGARSPVAIATDSIVSALRTLAAGDQHDKTQD
ncbi:hypothetical protein [Novosphingobium resinovorum]|uniref:hypothetical protein n=1 Tax=Novosphingobium resinovorum TaxID=158500 RepID=UPI002ED0A10C|nr:hypothetical protein [Novosphingobium resinovorum]